MHIILDTPGGTGLYLSFNIIAWLFVVVLISLGLWQITKNQQIVFSNMLLWIVAGIVCLLIPAFYTFEFTDHAIPRLLALTAGLLFLFSLYQFNVTDKQSTQLLFIILFAVTIEAVFALVQFFILQAGDWGGYKVGSSRPHGVFLQPNVMASFMATGLAIALYSSTKVETFKQPKYLNVFIIISLFITSFLLVLLQSRTGQIGAILALFLLAPMLYKSSSKKLALYLVVIIAAISVGISSLSDSELPQRGSDIYQHAGARAEIFTVSIDMIKTKPFTGYGYGGFERSFIDHFNVYAIKHPEIGNTIKRLAHPHNEVFLWAIEGGIVAILGLLFFGIGYVLTLTKLPLLKAAAMMALITPIFLHSLLEFPFYSSVSHWLIFLILLWLADQSIDNEHSSPNNAQTPWRSIACQKTFLIRFLALLSPAIFIPFLLTSMHTASILVEHEKSGFKNVERLQAIINPIAWKGRFETAVYVNTLVSGVKEKNLEKLTLYINWGMKRIKYKPRIGLYQNLMLAAKLTNKNALYLQLLEKAKRTYPQHINWREDSLTFPDVD